MRTSAVARVFRACDEIGRVGDAAQKPCFRGRWDCAVLVPVDAGVQGIEWGGCHEATRRNDGLPQAGRRWMESSDRQFLGATCARRIKLPARARTNLVSAPDLAIDRSAVHCLANGRFRVTQTSIRGRFQGNASSGDRPLHTIHQSLSANVKRPYS